MTEPPPDFPKDVENFLDALIKEIKGFQSLAPGHNLAKFGEFSLNRFLSEYFVTAYSADQQKTIKELEPNRNPFRRTISLVAQIIYAEMVGALKQPTMGPESLHYASLHPDKERFRTAKEFFVDNEYKKGRGKPGDSELLDLYEKFLLPTSIQHLKEQKQNIVAAVMNPNRTIKTIAPDAEDSIRQIFDSAFEHTITSLKEEGPPPEEHPLPRPEEQVRTVKEKENDLMAGAGGLLKQMWEWMIRVKGPHYAFIWWKMDRNDAQKIMNGHLFPDMRGDYRPGYTETPNKRLENLMAGLDGKEEGEVHGTFLGWMGLTLKGKLEGRPNGLDVPRFEVGEDEVVMLGAARIRRFDILRFRYNGSDGMRMDWSLLHWKWHIWEDLQKSTRAEDEKKTEKKIEKLAEDAKQIQEEEAKEGDHPLKWMTKEYYNLLKKFVEDIKTIVDNEKASSEQILLPVLRTKGDAWKGLYLACSLLWAYNKKIEPDINDKELKKILDMLPTRLYININNLEPYWRDTASKLSTTQMNDLLKAIIEEVENAAKKQKSRMRTNLQNLAIPSQT